MQAPFDIAADLDTPVSAYLKLKQFEPRFLLESVEGGERLARYSFLGFGPGGGPFFIDVPFAIWPILFQIPYCI